jgi:two-component system cell cycle response regulator DivK
MAARVPVKEVETGGSVAPGAKPAHRESQSGPTTAPAPDEAKSIPRRARRPKVLVADDDLDARTMYALYLQRMGCTVFTAIDGESAVDQAMAVLPDLIVLDLAMPRVTGWAAAKRLRRSPLTRGIPIVALTALPGARESARMSGCDAFMAKPCLPQLLWCEIRLLLGLEPTPAPAG